jgi:hypothetical protein
MHKNPAGNRQQVDHLFWQLLYHEMIVSKLQLLMLERNGKRVSERMMLNCRGNKTSVTSAVRIARADNFPQGSRDGQSRDPSATGLTSSNQAFTECWAMNLPTHLHWAMPHTFSRNAYTLHITHYHPHSASPIAIQNRFLPNHRHNISPNVTPKNHRLTHNVEKDSRQHQRHHPAPPEPPP